MAVRTVPGVAILAPVAAEHADILTPEAQEFVATLHRVFNPVRKELLKRRDQRQKELDAGRCDSASDIGRDKMGAHHG